MEKMQVRVTYFWMAVAVVLVLMLSGCATKTEWYENGQVKSHREGFIDWSSGGAKALPLANPSFSVIGK